MKMHGPIELYRDKSRFIVLHVLAIVFRVQRLLLSLQQGLTQCRHARLIVCRQQNLALRC
jgi:hypothetical protein